MHRKRSTGIDCRSVDDDLKELHEAARSLWFISSPVENGKVQQDSKSPAKERPVEPQFLRISQQVQRRESCVDDYEYGEMNPQAFDSFLIRLPQMISGSWHVYVSGIRLAEAGAK